MKSNTTEVDKELGKKRRSSSKKLDVKEIVQGEIILKNLFKKNAEYDTSEVIKFKYKFYL